MTGLTLDAGALIAVDRGDRRVLSLIALTAQKGLRLTVPATALAQAIRRPARQVRLRRLVRQPITDVVPLDGSDATATGRLLAVTRTSDIVDAHVVVCARRADQAIVSSDPEDLRRLDPGLRIVVV